MNLKERTFRHSLREIGDRIRERRSALKMTQKELRDRCGLHRTFIGSVERGERNFAILNLVAESECRSLQDVPGKAQKQVRPDWFGNSHVGRSDLLLFRQSPSLHDLLDHDRFGRFLGARIASCDTNAQ
jgi:transcriptional regulator with XRE-family HTH domain